VIWILRELLEHGFDCRRDYPLDSERLCRGTTDELVRKESMATAVTEQSFEQEVLQSDTPVLVDFWAEWCGPCHAVSPILERIADERPGELKLVKVNIDEEQGLALRFGVQSIPTMILFKGGEPAAAAIGAQPKPALERALGLNGAGASG
jgi:thioredoxin 1